MVNPAVVNQVAISYVKVRRGTSIQGVEMEETLNKRWPALFDSDTRKTKVTKSHSRRWLNIALRWLACVSPSLVR